ncbi:MAG: hypothetical protein ACJAZP_003060 [Psychromonas sp.]|jgi:hypothetical protein|uniref:hypothetical protein n=1 Tax=Psychromonas sp. TaxID=1884585 RepID=UPI0039E3056F
MKQVIAFFIFLLISLNTQAQGNSSFNSEIGHFAGGAVSAGITVVIVDRYVPEQNSAWVEFAINSAVYSLIEYRQYQLGDNSASDAGCLITYVGAAIGAYSTGKYIVSPTVALEANNSVLWN